MTAHTPGPWAVWPMGRILAITCTGRSKPHPSEGMHVAAVHMPEHNTQHDELWHANARLIAAAPDLLSCLTMGAELNTPDMLEWIADRLVSVHGESPFVDFVVSLRDRANAMRKAIAKAKGESA